MPDETMAHLPAGAQNSGYPSVEALLGEVNAVAIRLNQLGRTPSSSGGLPAAAHGVLQLLARHGPQTVPQIARQRSTSRQNIQMLINRLAGQGFVELRSNPAHRRSGLVSLTGRGRAALSQGGEARATVLQAVASHISEPELAGTARVLTQLRQLLSAEETSGATGSRESKTSQPRSGRRRRRPAEKQSAAVPEPPRAEPAGEKTATDEEEFPVSLL